MSQFGGGKSPGDGVNESPGGDIGDGFLDTRFDTLFTETTDGTDTTDDNEPEGDGMATFIQDGDAVDFQPATDVAAGEVVVQGDLVGVAKTPIATGTLGSLATQRRRDDHGQREQADRKSRGCCGGRGHHGAWAARALTLIRMRRTRRG